MEIRYPRPATTTRIHFGAGILPRVAERLRASADGRRIACIADDRVAALYAPALADEIEKAGLRADLVTFPAGEASKSRHEKARIEDLLLSLGFGRDSRILALGGGVTGDLAGFVAATFQRGVPFWQIPTTIVAMVDSSVGGKTAVDVPAGKNLIGAFHQPEEVFIDPALLATLPDRELRAGLVEAVKHALIRDADLFASIEEALDALLEPARNADLALGIIRRSIEIKAGVVSQDERESGLRSILNYGHTLGHALELLSRYSMLHGEAVAAGIAFAGRLAVRLGLLPETDADRQERILARLGVPTGTREDPARILDAFRLDKKARAGTPRFVLLEGIGRVAGAPERPTRAVDPAVLRECLEAFVAGGGSGADPK
ncbi:MAG: 3-dehydroquinate synthase, partial [Planctomycetes bacterium]|nr:3-dehydroquinate synthase [Planctomycetota bacterium]